MSNVINAQTTLEHMQEIILGTRLLPQKIYTFVMQYQGDIYEYTAKDWNAFTAGLLVVAGDEQWVRDGHRDLPAYIKDTHSVMQYEVGYGKNEVTIKTVRNQKKRGKEIQVIRYDTIQLALKA